MSLMDLLIYALVSLVGLIIINVAVRYLFKVEKTNNVKKWFTKFLIFSVVAYAVVLVILVYFYHVQII